MRNEARSEDLCCKLGPIQLLRPSDVDRPESEHRFLPVCKKPISLFKQRNTRFTDTIPSHKAWTDYDRAAIRAAMTPATPAGKGSES